METVFQASLALDAHLVQDLLERAGIDSHIEGEYLQGAAGGLPLDNPVRVRVAPERAAEARRVIVEWEKRQPAEPTPSPAPRKGSWAPYLFVLGCVLGFAVAWIRYNTPISEGGIDNDGDGTLDERFFYAGNKFTALEADRNFDGRVDFRYEYDSHGRAEQGQVDNDFDGRFETLEDMKYGRPYLRSTDRDGDGYAETAQELRNGVLVAEDISSPKSRAVLKRTNFTHGWPTSADYDADGDGHFDRHVEYDDLGDPRP